MPKHIVRLLAILIAFLLFAYAAIVYLTDPSFYRFGHYRAAAVPELAAGQPRYKGPDYCQSCHAERHGQWTTGGHASVKCEICHGPAGDHPATGKLPIPQDPIELCTTCHEAMPARPESQPQVVIAEHPYPHDEPLDCTDCHNPHSPGFGAPSTAQEVANVQQDAGTDIGGTPLAPGPVMPPTAAGCLGCHGSQGEGSETVPPLAGLKVPEFIEVMAQFRTGEKPSTVMGAIAKPLDEEQLVQLAEYFQALGHAAN